MCSLDEAYYQSFEVFINLGLSEFFLFCQVVLNVHCLNDENIEMVENIWITLKFIRWTYSIYS